MPKPRSPWLGGGFSNAEAVWIVMTGGRVTNTLQHSSLPQSENDPVLNVSSTDTEKPCTEGHTFNLLLLLPFIMLILLCHPEASFPTDRHTRPASIHDMFLKTVEILGTSTQRRLKVYRGE
jgi:hypothetical protein